MFSPFSTELPRADPKGPCWPMLSIFQWCIYIFMAMKGFLALLVVYDTDQIKLTVQRKSWLDPPEEKGKRLEDKGHPLQVAGNTQRI